MSTPMGHTTDEDLIDLLVTDHREVEQLFARLQTGVGTAEDRGNLRDAVIAELVRHAVAEEQYVYPTARRVLPDGDRLADQEIAEHAEAEEVMKRLEGVDPTDPQFQPLVTDLMATIRHHIQEEEADLFPRLREACDPGELRRLAGAVQAAKQLAPTRPHPRAPDRPPWNKLLGPGTGMVDRLRDVFSGRATSAEDVRRPR
jgi:hemerythrin superfamily protein